jgi:membrane fusion protein, multidrug efflux system
VSALAPTAVATRPAARGRSWTRFVAIVSLGALVLSGALAAGTLPRLRQQAAVQQAAAEVANAPPRVLVATARQAPQFTEQVLPGNSTALTEAGIRARTTGYIVKRPVDIGDQVAEGDLLAEIATPEIDAQLEQSRATVLQSRSDLVRDQAREAFSLAEEERYRKLVESKAIALQDYQSVAAQAKAATATVQATAATIKVNEADVLRLATLQSFEKVTAPFAGVVTARNINLGDLITANSTPSTPSATSSNGGTSIELYHLMQTDTLRIFVFVPQAYATSVKVGQTADVYRREQPGIIHAGKVTRTANALDLGTRTLQTEVQVPNADGTLRPGMYLMVKFQFERAAQPVLIPTAALATRTGQPRVAVLDDQQKVQYRTVQLARDYGAEIEVVSGLTAGDRIVVHPGDDLPVGTVVEPVEMKQPSAPVTSATPSPPKSPEISAAPEAVETVQPGSGAAPATPSSPTDPMTQAPSASKENTVAHGKER